MIPKCRASTRYTLPSTTAAGSPKAGEQDAEQQDAAEDDGDIVHLGEIDELGDGLVAEVEQGADEQDGDDAAPDALEETLAHEGLAHELGRGAHQQHTLDVEPLGEDANKAVS